MKRSSPTPERNGRRVYSSALSPKTAARLRDQIALSSKLLHELKVHQVELEAQNSQLRQTESELKAALQSFSGLYNFAPVGFLTLEPSGLILDANLLAARQLGRPRARLIGSDFKKLVEPEYEDLIVEILGSKKSSFRSRTINVQLVQQKKRRSRTVQLALARLQGRMLLALIDVTEVRHLQKAVTDAAALERERLRADLHDGLGQELTGLSLALAALRDERQDEALPWVSELEQLRRISSNAIATCRLIVHGLAPVAKDGGGLISALESFAKRSRRSDDPPIQLSIVGREPIHLDEFAADHVYRIAQEAINNAVKHSRATVIRVTLTISAKTLSLDVSDNGTGSKRSEEIAGHGLDIMQFRAHEIDGHLVIRRSSAGTKIHCVCPNRSEHAT